MTFTYERRLVTFSQFKWPHGKETKFKSQPEEVTNEEKTKNHDK